MSLKHPVLLAIVGVWILLAALSAAPRGGVARTTDKDEAESQPAQQLVAPTVVSRRIITKVDGVVVEEQEDTVLDPALSTYHPASDRPSPRVPDGVIYEPGKSDSVMPAQGREAAPTEPPPPDLEEKPNDALLGGMFSNFLNPAREVSSPRMRAGKRRGPQPATESSIEPEWPQYVMPEPPKELPFVAPSRNLIVGEVISVKEELGIAVAWMQSRFISLERNVITRNHEMETTAVLRPTHYRNGRAYGLEIAVGQPRIGDEIVLADAGPAKLRQDDLSYNVSVTVEPSALN